MSVNELSGKSMDQSGQDQLISRFQAARRDPEFAVLEGFHALKHAIRFKADLRAVVTNNLGGLELLAERLAPDVRDAISEHARAVPYNLFEQLSPGDQDPGVIALASRPVITRGMLHTLSFDAPMVLLESPSHLGNIGAVVRVAAAAGAAAVLTTGSHDPWHPHAIRGSAGLHFAIPVVRTDDYVFTDRPLIAIDPDGEDLEPASIPSNVVLAFGSERSGLSDDLLRRADARLRIPMEPAVSSLNLATAVAVVLYAWRLRQTKA